jgi:hypothetical protein
MSGSFRCLSNLSWVSLMAAFAASATSASAQNTRDLPAVVDAPKITAVRAQVPAANAKAPDMGLLRLRVTPRRNLEQDVEQFQLHCRPIMAVELHRLRAACDPSPAQRRRLVEVGLKAFKTVAKNDALDRQNRIVGQLDNPYTHSEPRTLVVNALSQAAKEIVSPEQLTRVRAEWTQRDEFQKQAIIRCLVLQLDDHVSLATDQRAKISDALSRAWTDDWYTSIEQLHQNNHYLRSIPVDCFWGFLDSRQRFIWTEYVQSPISGRFIRGVAAKGIIDADGPMTLEELGDGADRTGDAVPNEAQVR